MSEATDKMVTKKDSEQPLANHCDGSGSKVTEGPVTSRRTFTRNVLVGSAVLLTLTNRSAWGAKVVPCVSTNLLDSYRTGQPSALTAEQQQEIDDYDRFLNDDNYKVIKGPEDINGDTCYEAVSSNGNIDNTDSTFWFEKDTTIKDTTNNQ